jgi:transposase-like protein
MDTLDEHNKRMAEWRSAIAKANYGSGVLCPSCKTEMVETHPGTMNTSSPPSVSVRCPSCGRTGLKF